MRHGETKWNQEKRYQGQQDVPLSEMGARQAQQAAGRLADSGGRFLVSSDLSRARDTAIAIGKRLDLPVVCCSLWRERDYGRWEGLTREEIRELYLEEWRKNRASPRLTEPGGGETLSDLETRAIRALEWVTAEYPGQTGIVVSHGGLLRALLAWIAHDARPRIHLDNGGISMVQISATGTRQVVFANETSHLTDL